MMRLRIAAAVFAVIGAAGALSVHAQYSPAAMSDNYPAKPVRVVVGLAPGGATDIQARLFSQKLSEELGRQFVVDNRAGAGGLLAFQTVANAAADGYTLLAATPGFTIAPAFHDKPPYDPVRDFAAISLVTKAPYLIVVHPALPAKSLNELIVHAKAHPKTVNFGTGGLGTGVHLGIVWINNATRADITIIPYKGTGPVLVDLLAGQINVTFANIINVLVHVKSGRLRALAVTSAERSRALPDLPAVAESGIPGFDVTTWHGWLAPKGTPPAIVNRLSAGLARFVRQPEAMEKLAADGGEPVAGTPAQTAAFFTTEVVRWKKLVQATGLRIEP
jgi:tripartite-type tricarboxylate transporter receptor subunit TctC